MNSVFLIFKDTRRFRTQLIEIRTSIYMNNNIKLIYDTGHPKCLQLLPPYFELLPVSLGPSYYNRKNEHYTILLIYIIAVLIYFFTIALQGT